MEIAGEKFAAMLAAMDNAYMQARAADIKDVTRRILNNLMGVVESGIDSEVPVILAADDLAPSETIQLDKSKILGFITQGGSGNSHTAILARTMGIPAISGLGDALKPEIGGRTAYIDGETGQVAVEPDDITLAAFQGKYEKQQEMKALMQYVKGQEDVTLDGRKLMLYCNIGSLRIFRLFCQTTDGGSACSVRSFCTLLLMIIHLRKTSFRHTRKWLPPWKTGEWSYAHWTSALTSR